MPDDRRPLEGSTLQRRSLIDLDECLTQRFFGVACDHAMLARYEKRQPIAGWRVAVSFSDKVRHFDLIVDRGFPYAAPRIMLVDPPPFLSWPHTEKDGALCLLGNQASIDPNDPVSVASQLLRDAVELIDTNLQGMNEDDFREEFHSYWHRAKSENAPAVVSLVAPVAPSRLVQVWRGQAIYLVADDAGSAVGWLRNRHKDMPKEEMSTEPALLLALARPLLPRDYPNSAKEVLALVRKSDATAATLFDTIVAGQPERIVVVFLAQSANGACLCAVSLTRPKANQYGTNDPLLKGFRKHTIPPAILTNRYVSGTAHRLSVNRADHAWIHARGNDTVELQKLRSAHVIIAGAGSIGAPVAVLLAQAGVGRMSFADAGILGWENIGRHSLGAPQVDTNKAAGLKDHLLARFPHLSIDAYPTSWEDAYASNLHLFDDAALVISATGEWAAEASLNDWHLESGRKIPIIYTWTEPYACAGHAVAIARNGACFACGFSGNGTPLFAVTQWKEPTLRRVPACGDTFQPYGAIDLQPTVTLAARLALDCLIETMQGSLHRIWAGPRRPLLKAGGD